MQEEVSEEDTETDYGHMDADAVPIKDGCDLFVLGSAYAPKQKEPVSSMYVSIKVGDHKREFKICGDRYWQKRMGSLSPSQPVPFEKISLTYQHAFGGAAEPIAPPDSNLPEGLTTTFQDNPLGCGFVLQKALAPGVKLPNIESAGGLIVKWDDHPVPAGIAPLPRVSSLRSSRGYVADEETKKLTIEPAAFLSCHPDMHMANYPAMQRVHIVGMRADGDWKFTLPSIHLSLKVSLGSAQYQIPMIPDTICLIPEENRFFVVSRRALVYQFVPERKRSITVCTGERSVDKRNWSFPCPP